MTSSKIEKYCIDIGDWESEYDLGYNVINIGGDKDTTGTDITGSDDSQVGEDGTEVEDIVESEDSIGRDDYLFDEDSDDFLEVIKMV